MTKLILSAITVVATFAFWLWRRYWSKGAEIARLQKRIGELISEELPNALEHNDTMLFDVFDDERLRLCEKVRRIRGR